MKTFSQLTASIHIGKSLKIQPHEPKIDKEYACTNADRKRN